MKKIISFLLAIVMIIGTIPTRDLVAWADDPPKVTGVLVTKTYSKPLELEVIYIEVKGTNLEKLGKNPVIVRDQMGAPIPLTTIVESADRLYYNIEKPQGIARMIIAGEDYDIGAEKMPQVTNLTPPNGLVKSTETLIIHGSGFKDFIKKGDNNTNGKINFYNSTGSIEETVTDNVHSDKEIHKTFLSNSKGGPYRVELKYKEEYKDKDENSVKAPLTIEDNYVNLFTLLGDLNISEYIEMSSNQGAPGTEVTISGDELIEDMSVFFLRDENDVFDIKNMGEFVNYRKDAKDKKDNFIVKVPNLDQGTYHVVLTNKVNQGEDPNKVIHSTRTFDNNIFIIISDGNQATIEQVNPDHGPATGTDATIRGRNLWRMSPSLFKPVENKKGTPTIKPNTNSLDVTYEYESNVIGKYLGLNTATGGVDVLKLERKITGYVGNQLEFKGISKSLEEALKETSDYIDVKIPEVTDEKTDPVKDVTLEIKTTITYKYKYKDKDGNDKEETKTIILIEKVKWDKKFTFEQLGYEPKINNILPVKIPVDQSGDVYKTSLENMKISILGENFSVYKYIEKDGKGNDVVKYKYPEVNIGKQIILNKNEDSNVDIKVLDRNNNEIDGSKGNELGSRILITIPKDLPSKGLSKGYIGSNTDVWVRNPLRNENPTEMGTTSDPGTIQFVSVDEGKKPKITKITPNTVTTDGQKGVVITGQDIGTNFKVYMDGVEITGAKRNEIGTEIIFDAPPAKEGFTQILVQNEEGGAAVYYPFTYVKTYTNPRITDFTPKKGTAKAKVTITGENFVLPNPLVKDLTGIGIWKLIGTRVLLGEEDVNEYYMVGKSPGLQTYTSDENDPLIKNDKGKLVFSGEPKETEKTEEWIEDYHSIILQEGDDNPTYYTIFFDTKTGEYKLTDGDKQVYVIEPKGEDGLIGNKEHKIDVEKDRIKIDGKELIFKTPYAINDDGKIVGNKSKIINNNEIIFKVPPKPRDGYYDVTVVNPDTNSDSKTGENGFYYAFKPDHNPEIIEIKPKEGSVDGGYYINIFGKGFEDNGLDKKTSVSIGSVEVDPKDIEVSPDGKNLRVKVPKYPGDLEKETDMDRKSVLVSVVNPDGGGTSKIDGFTYIIPISHPEITALVLNKGSAAGGDTVTIEGDQFRFYEPFKDLNGNLVWDEGEPFTKDNDLNGNGKWDDLRYWQDLDLKKAYEKLSKDYEKNILPILPKVYFGGKEIPVLRFTKTQLEIETPKGEGGVVEVYIVNNDYGVSNKLTFTYESSNPRIDKVLNDVGAKQGNKKVEILGENFYESEIEVVASSSATKKEKMPIVQFGNREDTEISNKTIPIDALENSGRIRDGQTKVKINNLTVEYDATQDDRLLKFTIEEGIGKNKEFYKFNYDKYDDTEIFVPIKLLKNDKDEAYNGHEYVRVKLERVTGATSTYRLRVDRGFSPEAKLLSIGQISLRTPSYYTVGTVVVTLYNPDGGEATGNYTYKNPDSDPTITNILGNDQEGYLEDGVKIIDVNYNGGNIIDVIGSDFRKPVTISIGDVVDITQGIEYDPDEAISKKMTFKMPAVDEKYAVDKKDKVDRKTCHRVVVANEDGGVVGSDEVNSNPIYIRFIKGETPDLAITKVTPNLGSTAGGTLVTIEGKEFRSKVKGYPDGELKVYFGDGKDQVRVKKENIISIEIDKIQVITPPHSAGDVSIKVENPDGNIVELPKAFTYTSNPKINSVVDPENENDVIDIISIDGGEEIKIKGSGFMEGVRVLFVPKLKEVVDEDTGDTVYINGNPDDKRIVEGIEGADIKYIDEGTLVLKTPVGKLDQIGIIVINPDGGASTIYVGIKYGLAEMKEPQNVKAEIVYDRYIKINWSGVKDAKEYEIYVVINDNERYLVGNTELTSFIYEDLESDTTYKFVVTALGEYGSSIHSEESNEVETNSKVGPEDEDGELGEKTEIENIGGTANIIIGEDDYEKELNIDLTTGKLAGAKEVVISIPAKVAASYDAKEVTVVGRDYQVKFHPNAFYSQKVRENKNKRDAGVRFVIKPLYENTFTQSIKGQISLSEQYILKASVYEGQNNTDMIYLPSYIQIILDVDKRKADMRRLKHLNLSYYDQEEARWIPIASGNKNSYVIVGNTDKLGKFTVIGSRR